MDYPEEIRTGDILGVEGTSFLAKAIQWFQRLADKPSAHINHVALFWWINGRLYVIEAGIKGITFLQFEHYLKGKSTLYHIRYQGELDYFEEKAMENLFEKYQNRKYSFISLFKYQIVYKLTGWFTGNKNPKKMICEAFVQRVWNDLKGYFPEWYKGNISAIYYNEHFKTSLL